jgi:YD repeat-containing protein
VPVAGAPAGTESWTYDPDSGRVATFTDGSGRRTNTWDSLGRLDAVGFAEPGGATVAYDYGYNERGDVTSIGAPDGLWTRAVNTTGQVTGLTGPDGRHTSWSYDTAGRRDTMGLPDGTVWRYGYDNLSRLTAIRAAAPIADTFTQPAGGLLQMRASGTGSPKHQAAPSPWLTIVSCGCGEHVGVELGGHTQPSEHR